MYSQKGSILGGQLPFGAMAAKFKEQSVGSLRLAESSPAACQLYRPWHSVKACTRSLSSIDRGVGLAVFDLLVGMWYQCGCLPLVFPAQWKVG